MTRKGNNQTGWGGCVQTPMLDRESWMDRFGVWFVPEPNTGCWVWAKKPNATGYAYVSCGGKQWGAHRLSWLLLRGPIQEGMQIDHLCRCRSCVNPDHMEVVTPAENKARGKSPAAIAARLTHCKRGHELSGDNIDTKRGYRECIPCRKWLRRRRWIMRKS